MPKDFERLNRDDNKVPIMTGVGIATQDATGTPQKSPLAFTTGVTTIEVPTNAAEIVLKPSVALRISEEATVSDRYFVIGAGTTMAIGVADTDTIYVAGDSASGTLNFYFVTV